MMSEQKTQIEDIDIAPEMFTYCPLTPGNLVPVANVCLPCEHFAGLQCRSDNAEIAFEGRYRVLCKHPNALDLFRVRLDLMKKG
jgi:hypothetical protein